MKVKRERQQQRQTTTTTKRAQQKAARRREHYSLYNCQMKEVEITRAEASARGYADLGEGWAYFLCTKCSRIEKSYVEIV